MGGRQRRETGAERDRDRDSKHGACSLIFPKDRPCLFFTSITDPSDSCQAIMPTFHAHLRPHPSSNRHTRLTDRNPIELSAIIAVVILTCVLTRTLFPKTVDNQGSPGTTSLFFSMTSHAVTRRGSLFALLTPVQTLTRRGLSCLEAPKSWSHA